jgi:transposase
MIQMAKRRRYTAEFKGQAVELVRLGKAAQDVAEELGIGSGILYKWVAAASGMAEGEGMEEAAEAKELQSLRRENARLKLENDILKKAAVILGTQFPPSAGR